MVNEREVAGLRCFQVLEKLNDYLDGEVDAVTRTSFERHLAGCDVCARFGGHMGALVRGLKNALAAEGTLETGTANRLREALSRAMD